MIELLPLALALIAGLGLGSFYFGGLWLTVERLPVTRKPTLLTLGSFIGRTGVTLLGFYFATGGYLMRLSACLLGFILMRTILVRCWRPERRSAAGDGGHMCR